MSWKLLWKHGIRVLTEAGQGETHLEVEDGDPT